MAGRTVDPRFGARMRELLAERGLSYRALAARTHYAKSHLHALATGAKAPTPSTARRVDDALGAGGHLASLASPTRPRRDGADADELARRVAASDVSTATLNGIESVIDDLAVAYPLTPPAALLPLVRRHLAYVTRLVDARKTLDQHRRLLVAGGWLSLLAATAHIDLRDRTEATAHLDCARALAEHADHPEIAAWALETRAWDALTAGELSAAAELAGLARTVAPRGSSARIQATAQEGRAWARMGDARQTRAALGRTARLAATLPAPESPEHHYRYDPSKALAYVATTLAWVGDPAAEHHAHTVVAELEAAADGVPRPRRVASARLDLGLALLANRRPDEAAAQALRAVMSGRLVPSNWWRLTEIVTGVERAGLPEAGELREACRVYHPERVAR